MALNLQRETTEYVYVGITGGPPTVGAEVAFLGAGIRPTEPDWTDAVVVDTVGHELWADATAAGATGDYYIARLVGDFGTGGVELVPGDYQEWLRLTDTVERPVRIAPVAVTIL